MAKISLEDFSDNQIARIYIARNIKEAERAEQILSKNGVDYAIELEPYWQMVLFASEYIGAAFYVLFNQAEVCQEIFRTEGMKAGLVD